MNRKEKALLEMFGEPLEPIYGKKIGDVEGIADVGAVGVRDVSEDIVVCPACGEMPINGQCGCADSDVCPMCGQMPPRLDSTCSCGLMEATCADQPTTGMAGPAEFAKKTLEMMSGLGEACIEEPSSINEPSESDVASAAGVSEGEGYGQCKQCSMKEMECECGMNEGDLDEVTPAGYEPIVKALKKEPEVDNPWAVAWSMKKKGIGPRR